MLASISRNWWLLALRGALAVVFGIAAFVWPGITFDILVLLFGAYAFIDGVVVLGFGLMAAGAGRHRRDRRWGADVHAAGRHGVGPGLCDWRMGHRHWPAGDCRRDSS